MSGEKNPVRVLVDYLEGEMPAVPLPAGVERSGLQYTGRSVIVTGGNKGMGEGIARVFVDAGADVLTCGRDVETGQNLASELNQKGPGKCVFEPCDVSKPENIRTTVEKAVECFGKLDCLVNNAGAHPPLAPFSEHSRDDLIDLMNTNFVSQFEFCRLAIEHLRKTKGNIINMSSCTAKLGQDGGAIYSATKGAICSFTKSLAIEEAPHGVRVNCVLPGNIYTESRKQFVESFGEHGADTDRWAEGLQPMGRSGSIEEAGQVILFLASDAASYLTGVELMISAGIELGQGLKYPSLWTGP